MTAARDLLSIGAGAVLAVGGILAAVQADQGATAAPLIEAPVPVPARVTPAPTSGDAAPVPSAVRDVLDEARGAAVRAFDAEALAEHVPPSVSAVLTERGVVLAVPPDTELVP